MQDKPEGSDTEVKKAEARLDEWGAGMRSLEAGRKAEGRKTFTGRMEARLDQMHAEIDRLAAKAKKGTVELQDRVESLFDRESKVRNRLDTVKREGSEVADEARADLENAADELQRKVEKTRERF